jgi:hypothetical protein
MAALQGSSEPSSRWELGVVLGTGQRGKVRLANRIGDDKMVRQHCFFSFTHDVSDFSSFLKKIPLFLLDFIFLSNSLP